MDGRQIKVKVKRRMLAFLCLLVADDDYDDEYRTFIVFRKMGMTRQIDGNFKP